MTQFSLLLLALLTSLAWSFAAPAQAANPVTQSLHDGDIADLFDVENGKVEAATVDGEPVIRWHINNGQTSILSMRPEHPLFDRLRYYDRMQFEFRIASGEIGGLGLSAVGHVSGPRQYKVHSFSLAKVTTKRDTWHFRELDLASPYWFPWDNADGEGEQGYFRFDALGIADDTVVEIRAARLLRGLLYRKPDFETPITWPIKTENDDGSVTYTLKWIVINSSGQPTDLTAKIVSKHEHFSVALDKDSEAVKAAGRATFTATATMSKASIEATSELYTEPLRVEFAIGHRPEVTSVWEGPLVRPLSDDINKQVLIPDAELKLLRETLAGDKGDELRTAIEYDQLIAAADEFVSKQFDSLPRSHNHVRNGYSGDWRPAERMPEIVNLKTGERQNGTALAGYTWKEYFALTGQATYKTGLAYALTQDEKYAQKAIELLELYARQYTEQHWWVLFDVPYFQGAPIQTSSRVASNSSYGSNWYFKWHCKMISLIADSPSWTPEAKQRIYEGFVVPYVTELTKLPGGISNQTDISNHNFVLLGLAFDDATLVHYGTMEDAGVVKRLQDIDSDGFSAEGRPLNYHFAAMDEYLPTVTFLENSNLGIDYGKERIINALRMPYERATLTGKVPNAGDIGRGASVRPTPHADVLLSIAPDQDWLRKIGRQSTLSAKLHTVLEGDAPPRDAWLEMISTKPKLFKEAGFAIMRTGDTADDQVMVTFDYGRSAFHDGLNRGQLTMSAYGLIYTQGPGSLYNAGRGGIQYNETPQLKSFSGYHSLGHNVVTVDQQSQLRTVGELVAWSDKDDKQVAVATLDGAYPGVSHTRGVLLSDGIVVLFDRLTSDKSHSYDFVYHNFGKLVPGEGWSIKPLDKPLGSTGNYDNIVDPAALEGEGMIRLTWDLSREYPYWRDKEDDPSKHLPHRLALWQLPIEGGHAFTGKTGLNNHNTNIMSDEAPTLIHRVEAKAVEYVTVLEPFKGESRVKAVASNGKGGVAVTLNDGTVIEASLDDLIAWGMR